MTCTQPLLSVKKTDASAQAEAVCLGLTSLIKIIQTAMRDRMPFELVLGILDSRVTLDAKRRIVLAYQSDREDPHGWHRTTANAFRRRGGFAAFA